MCPRQASGHHVNSLSILSMRRARAGRVVPSGYDPVGDFKSMIEVRFLLRVV